MIRRPPRSTLFPTRRSSDLHGLLLAGTQHGRRRGWSLPRPLAVATTFVLVVLGWVLFRMRSATDRKSTRLNSSHLVISYAVFCLKKTNNTHCCVHPYSSRAQ